MNQKKTLLILLAVFAALLAGAYGLYQHLGSKVDPQQFSQTESAVQQEDLAGQNAKPQKVPAPDFLVYDQAGNAVHLSDFLGTPVVLNFWASWCGPCRNEMPEFQTAYETYGESVQFLMVNMTDGSRETAETASALITANGYTFPVLYDLELRAAIAYGVRSLPTTYFIDAEGYAVVYGVGAMNLEVLETGIGMILPS